VAFSPRPRPRRPVLLVRVADTEQWMRLKAKIRAALPVAKARTRQKRVGKTSPSLVWIACPGRGATSLARPRRAIARCVRLGDTQVGREQILLARVDHASRVAFRRRSVRSLPTRANHAQWEKRNRLPHLLSACRACPASIKIKRGNPNARSAKKGDTRQARTPRLSASCVPGEGTLKRSNPHVRCAHRGDTAAGERDKVAKVTHATIALGEDTPQPLAQRPYLCVCIAARAPGRVQLLPTCRQRANLAKRVAFRCFKGKGHAIGARLGILVKTTAPRSVRPCLRGRTTFLARSQIRRHSASLVTSARARPRGGSLVHPDPMRRAKALCPA
jgi:hypothetical protein